MSEIDVFNIIPGLLCNFSCSHCVSSSSPSNKTIITENETRAVVSDILEFKPHKILFTGGEPTLFIEKINEICALVISDGYRPSIGITSNGWFGTSLHKAIEVLDQIRFLDFVQISIDSAHSFKNAKIKVKNIQNYCLLKAFRFSITAAIVDPMELIEISSIQEELGVEVLIQKASPVGRAKETGSYFKYYSYDQANLKAYCPAKEHLTFAPGKGVSRCCSSLMFDNQSNVFRKSNAKAFFESEFNRLIVANTFQEIINEHDLKLDTTDPMLNDICFLCSKVFAQMEKKL